MLSGQQYQLTSGQHLDKLLLHGNKRAVSSSGSTVHVVWAAVPVDFWAASSWAFSSGALLLGSHLDKLFFCGNEWAI